MKPALVIRLLLLLGTLCLCPWIMRSDLAQRLGEQAGWAWVAGACSLLVIVALILFVSACVDYCRDLRLLRRIRTISQSSVSQLSADLVDRFAQIDHACQRVGAILSRFPATTETADWHDRLMILRRLMLLALAALQNERQRAAAQESGGTDGESVGGVASPCDAMVTQLTRECETSLAVAVALPPVLPAPALTDAIAGECGRLDKALAPIQRVLENTSIGPKG